MRCALAFSLLAAGLWLAPAASASAILKRNNDASLQPPHLVQRFQVQRVRPRAEPNDEQGTRRSNGRRR